MVGDEILRGLHPRLAALLDRLLKRPDVEPVALYISVRPGSRFHVYGLRDKKHGYRAVYEDEELFNLVKELEGLGTVLKAESGKVMLAGHSLGPYPEMLRLVWYGKLAPKDLWVIADAAAELWSPYLARVAREAILRAIRSAEESHEIEDIVESIRRAPPYRSRKYRIEYSDLLRLARRRLHALRSAEQAPNQQ